MPTGNLMTTVIILKVRWIGEPWEWTRYSLLVFRVASHVTKKKKKKKKKEKKKRKIGTRRTRYGYLFLPTTRLTFMLSIVECHWATDIRPIVYTHHGLLYYNGNPITTARDLIRIIDFTGNHGATFSSESFAGFIIAIESERLFSSKLESAVYHWLTCMHDERGWLWITKEESWWILFPFSFLFVISLFLFLFCFYHVKRIFGMISFPEYSLRKR